MGRENNDLMIDYDLNNDDLFRNCLFGQAAAVSGRLYTT